MNLKTSVILGKYGDENMTKNRVNTNFHALIEFCGAVIKLK